MLYAQNTTKGNPVLSNTEPFIVREVEETFDTVKDDRYSSDHENVGACEGEEVGTADG